MNIRISKPEDLEAIVEIYNQATLPARKLLILHHSLSMIERVGLAAIPLINTRYWLLKKLDRSLAT